MWLCMGPHGEYVILSKARVGSMAYGLVLSWGATGSFYRAGGLGPDTEELLAAPMPLPLFPAFPISLASSWAQLPANGVLQPGGRVWGQEQEEAAAKQTRFAAAWPWYGCRESCPPLKHHWSHLAHIGSKASCSSHSLLKVVRCWSKAWHYR